jgi:addiction module HigA family antidote
MSTLHETEELLPSIHPGEVLEEDFLKPLGMTAYRLAKSIGVPQTRIGQILKRERAVSADTALRLGRFFNTTAEFWMGLQGQYDLEIARRSQRQEYERIDAYAA